MKYKENGLYKSERSGRIYQYRNGEIYLHTPCEGDKMKIGEKYTPEWKSLPLTEVKD